MTYTGHEQIFPFLHPDKNNAESSCKNTNVEILEIDVPMIGIKFFL